ncbi:DMT family transporter [Micromonospora sp. BRA006-A]|nr:DMT family transporter [Micromonospora sp. BRA006-A]
MRSRHATLPIFAVVSWGVMFPVLASALTRVDALNLTTVRYVLATAVLLALLLAREGVAALATQRRGTEVVLLGALGFAGFNTLTNLALGHAAPQQIALFAATVPLVTQFVRWARDGVRPRPVLLGISLVALAGVGLVITRGRLDGLGQFGWGGLLMIGAVFGWAFYTHGASRFPVVRAALHHADRRRGHDRDARRQRRRRPHRAPARARRRRPRRRRSAARVRGADRRRPRGAGVEHRRPPARPGECRAVHEPGAGGHVRGADRARIPAGRGGAGGRRADHRRPGGREPRHPYPFGSGDRDGAGAGRGGGPARRGGPGRGGRTLSRPTAWEPEVARS